MRKLLAVVVFWGAFAADGWSACDFKSTKERSLEILKPVRPKVGGKAVYRQALIFPNGSKEKLKKQTDYKHREIPIALQDSGTCKLDWVMESRKVQKNQLTNPLGGYVRLAERAFRAIWNDFNTQFFAAGRVAILVKWRRFGSKEYLYYVPYSPDLARMFPELNLEGREHFPKDMNEALSGLRERGFLEPDFEPTLRELLPRIFAAESIDPFEFKAADEAARKRLMDQPFVTLGANGDIAYTLKVSSAGAKGPMQVWYKSCKDVRRFYPGAGIAKDCNGASWGSHSHIGNIAAAALEIQMHRRILMKEKFLGPDVVSRPDFKRMLEASYNGGPGHVIKAFRQYGENWDKLHYVKVQSRHGKKKVQITVLSGKSLLGETVDYLLKCDHLARMERKGWAEIVAGSE